MENREMPENAPAPDIAQAAQQNYFMAYNHIRIGVMRQDYAETYLDIVQESTNLYHVVHGGAFFTLADCCAGLAARSNGRSYVPQHAPSQFVRNGAQGRITARGQVLQRGRRVCLVEVRITDEEGKLLFCSMFSMYCVSGK